MAHAQKPDLIFQRNGRVHLNRWGRVHLNRWGRQFSRLLAAEVCSSAVVMRIMLDTPCSEVQCKTTGYTLYSHVSSSLPLPCVTMCHQVSTELYHMPAFLPTDSKQHLPFRMFSTKSLAETRAGIQPFTSH